MNICEISSTLFHDFVGVDVARTETYHLKEASSSAELHMYHLKLAGGSEILLSDVLKAHGIDFKCISYAVYSGHAYLYVDGAEQEIGPSSVVLVPQHLDQRIINHGVSALILVLTLC